MTKESSGWARYFGAAVVGVLLLTGICYTQSSPVSQTESPEALESRRMIASIVKLYTEGKFDEALSLALRVVEIEKGLGPERPEVAAALARVAELYFVKRNDGEAEKLFEQAAAIYDKNQSNSPAVSSVLERLAQFNFLKKKYDVATRLLDRSLVIREQAFGSESSQVSDTLHELANVYQVDNKFQKSEPLYLRSIAINEKLLGRTDPVTVGAMKDYACLRVKNYELKLKGTNTDPTEAEIEQQSIRERASCWLYGFHGECEKVSYHPPVKSSELLNGKALNLVAPPYPPEARSKHISGTIFVAVLIDEDGKVIDAKPVCSVHPELTGVGVVAARASKFSPTKRNGQAIQVTGFIVYRFIAQ